MSRIVITDPHGCIKTLKALVAKFPPHIPVTVAGDLVDRGPGSRQVIDLVINSGFDCVMGNHERMMLDECGVLNDGSVWTTGYMHGIWLMNGGTETLKSYLEDIKVKEDGTPADFPYQKEYNANALREHLEWMKRLPYYIEYKDLKNDKGQHLVVSHSSAAKAWHLKDGDLMQQRHFESEVIWGRNAFPPKIPDAFNVFGHTPQKHGPTIRDHWACIDNGVYLGGSGPYGKMYALQFPEMIIYEQEYLDGESAT